MKKLLFVSLLIIFSSLFSAVVSAQTATDSADVSEDEVKQNVKDRLEKVAGTTAIKRAWVGTIADIANHTLSLKSGDLTRQVEVADAAKIIGSDRQPIKYTDLEIGKFIIAMGYLNDKGVLDGRRIVIAELPTASAYTASLITTTDLKLKPTKDTSITQTRDRSLTDIDFTDLKPEDRILVISSTKTLTHVHLLESRPIISASPTSSPAASPKQ